MGVGESALPRTAAMDNTYTGIENAAVSAAIRIRHAVLDIHRRRARGKCRVILIKGKRAHKRFGYICYTRDMLAKIPDGYISTELETGATGFMTKFRF